MSLQVSLKLSLFKEVKRISVKYNTFEKASYDEYLICSLALRTSRLAQKRDEVALHYIDDITGEGSLNEHFKKLYERVKAFTVDQLENVMNNSMIPVFKIDKSNSYLFYPDLNVSEFNGKIYSGDLGSYENLIDILMIKEDIIDMSVENAKESRDPEQYTVLLDDSGDVKIKIADKLLAAENGIFEKALYAPLSNLGRYVGKIYDRAEGNGWHVLTASVLENLVSSQCCYYENGDHYYVRSESLRKTVVANVHGLFIYREEIIPYEGNPVACEKAVEFIVKNKMFGQFAVKALIKMAKNIPLKKAQSLINGMLLKGDDNCAAEYALDLMEKGVINGWTLTVQRILMKHANAQQLNLIYQVNSDLEYTLEQLVQIDFNILYPRHQNMVRKYFADADEKRQTIRKITGDITTRGLREKAKELKADEITKKFGKLCNKLIGHVSSNLDEISINELNQWHQDALELMELAKQIELKISKG